MKVAVVGSGISGLAAIWLLNEHTNHEVHLYESDSRPGGHANTVLFARPGKPAVHVDTGFIVFNPITYPNFLRFLLLHPNLAECIRATQMTLSVSRDNGAFEWAGKSLSSVFCQPLCVLDPDRWRLLYDIFRFNACALRVLYREHASSRESEISVGEYLHNEGYSETFRDNYLIPMTAAIWSTPPDKCTLGFPIRTLIQFMHNHHLLQITGKPSWLTLHGGSRVYVEKILSALPREQLHLSTPIRSVSSSQKQGKQVVELMTASGERVSYDRVILACHSDTALAILREGGAITEDENRLMGSFRWSRNAAVLHWDERLMPKRRAAWSCWNYLTQSHVDKSGRKQANVDQVSLTYWMNDLQHISEETHGPVLVTLNPPFEPQPEHTVGTYAYDHPVLDTQAVRAQQQMHVIQGQRGIFFAGAWLGYGFHEDGFTSGLRAAVAVAQDGKGALKMPFEIATADHRLNPGVQIFPLFFDLLEKSGLRAMVGSCLALFLRAIRFVVHIAGIV